MSRERDLDNCFGAREGESRKRTDPAAAKLARRYLKFNVRNDPMAKPPRDSDELYGFSRKLDRLLEKARPIFREFADYLGRQRLGLARRLKHVENVCRFERRFLVDRQVERVSSKEFKQAFSKILNDKGLDNDTKKLYRVSLKKFYEFLLAEREEKSGDIQIAPGVTIADIEENLKRQEESEREINPGEVEIAPGVTLAKVEENLKGAENQENQIDLTNIEVAPGLTAAQVEENLKQQER